MLFYGCGVSSCIAGRTTSTSLICSSGVIYRFSRSSSLPGAGVCFWILMRRIFTLLSAWRDHMNTILYGLVITALFFMAMRSVIYRRQCSCGLMMHGSLCQSDMEGYRGNKSLVLPRLFVTILHSHAALVSFPPLLLSVNCQGNYMTCLSCNLTEVGADHTAL